MECGVLFAPKLSKPENWMQAYVPKPMMGQENTYVFRAPEKRGYNIWDNSKMIFLISQLKQILSPLIRTFSLRRF